MDNERKLDHKILWERRRHMSNGSSFRKNNDYLKQVPNNTCASIRGNTRGTSVIHRY